MTGLPSMRRVMQGCAMPLLLLSFLLMLAGRMQAQEIPVLDTRVSYKAVKQPLSTVLKDIRTISNVRFTYNMDQVRKAPLVTVNQQNVTLRELLQQVLANSGLSFAEYFRGVMIIPEKAKVVQRGVLGFPVRGQVQTSDGASLAGATVQIVGTGEGSVTMQDGLFSMVMYDRQQLRISMLGMKTILRTVTAEDAKKELMIIRLDTAAREIGEVVVNGYQKIDARMSTASVFKLDAAQVIQPGETSVDRMLQGKVPGLMIMNTSGSVNGRPTIRMRGTSTFVGNASPLWVIDGVVRPDPVDMSSTQLNNVISDAQTGNFSMIGNAVSGLNPYDIENITFLKDAAATAIYGVRAANGVIVVTTKRGKAGPMRVSYNTSMSFQARPSYNNLNLMNSRERLQLSQELFDAHLMQTQTFGVAETFSYEGLVQALFSRSITEAQFKTAVAKLGTNNTDWFKLLFRNSFSMTHSLSLSGGAAKTTYYGSVSYTDGRGAAQLDGMKRYTANLSLHTEAGKRLMVDFQLSGNYNTQQGYFGSINPMTYALTTTRTLAASANYPFQMSHIKALPVPPPTTFNILNEIAQSENNSSTKSMVAGLELSYKIIGGLTFRNTSSVITSASEAMSAAYEGSAYMTDLRGWNIDYTPTDAQLKESVYPYGGITNLGSQNMLTLNTRNMLEYNMSLFRNRDQFIVTAGNEISSVQTKGLSTTQPGYFPDRGMNFFPGPGALLSTADFSITKGTLNTMSLFGTAVYSLNNKYIISGTIRSDGSNRFGQYSNAKFLPNYGLSAKWNLGNERFLQTSRIISGLSIRGSLGTQGNVVSAVGPELIATYSKLPQDKNEITGVPFLGIKSLPYPDLRWEKTYQWNFGIDLSLFDSRLNLTSDYYMKRSKDLLISKALPYEFGVDAMYKNAGNLTNQGVELTMAVQVIRKKNTNLTLSFNTSKNFNEIGTNEFTNANTGYLSANAFVPGKPISGFYSYRFAGLDPTNGTPMFHDLEGKGLTDDPTSYLVFSGQKIPAISGGFSPSFRYKNLSASALFAFSAGSHKRLNPINPTLAGGDAVPPPFVNVNRDLSHRWKKPGDEKLTDIPAIVDQTTITALPGIGTSSYGAYDQSDLRVVNNSFIRCREIRMNYAIPMQFVQRTGIKSMTAGLFVQNVFTIASRKLQGQDPEIDGVGGSTLPVTRQYGFTMNVTF